MIIVTFDIIDIYTGKTGGAPPYLVISSFNVMLVLFILDRNVLAYIKRKAIRMPFLRSLHNHFNKVTPAPYIVYV
jgi:hypothetical protein